MDIEKYMFPCISKTLFGIECLGCGFQRAFVLLFQGDFEAAFKMYPAIYASLTLVACIGLQFVDRKHNYKKTVSFLGFTTGIFMIGGYYFKHFL